MVSVVIPTYNRAQLVSEAVQSALADPSVGEVIVVDDGSEDDTASVVKLLSHQNHAIQYVYQENCGASVARNTGLKIATGEFIRFLDSDDLIVAAGARRQAEILGLDPSIMFCYGCVRTHAGDPSVCSEVVGGSDRPSRTISLDFLRRFPFPVCSPLYRRTFCESLGGFNPELRQYEDWEFNFRAGLEDSVSAHVAETVAVVRVHSGPRMSHQVKRSMPYFEYLQSLQRWLDIAERHGTSIRNRWVREMTRCSFWAARDGDEELANRCLAIAACGKKDLRLSLTVGLIRAAFETVGTARTVEGFDRMMAILRS
jgi:glycosyltransferase involved in cell wall biosynthesis